MASDVNFDWAHVQALKAVAETGSLSAAARQLGLSQPTVGRQIKTMEDALGMELFTRVPKGLAPTKACLSILPHATTMAEAAARLAMTAQGQEVDLSGTVRITASVVVCHFVLPPILSEMRLQYPEIQIELVPSDTTENLIYREADIAIRMYRPTQLDIVAQHIGDAPLGLFAASAYLDRAGRPRDVDSLMGLDFIGLDKSELALRMMAGMGIEVSRDFFALRTDDQAAFWQLARAGCGVAAAQVVVGEADPTVERIFPELALPALPVWLAAPEILRQSQRLRTVWDFLAAELKGIYAGSGSG